MNNILTIYKFNFPFYDISFENIKAREIISDLKRLFQYNDILISATKEVKWDYIYTNIIFTWWEINIIFHDDNINYFIPKFQFDLSVNEDFRENIYIEIIKIFETIWFQEYICLFQKEPKFLEHFEVNTLKNLELNFEKYNFENLSNFITTTDKDYIDYKLKENKLIRNSFYYMIFLCYIFYRNMTESEKNILKIDKLLQQEIFELYKWNLDLGKTRLIELENISIINFKKYQAMLDKLFELIWK
jgi:hypothetical protein